jgi:GTPase Era involved in 16S rRNA processing
VAPIRCALTIWLHRQGIADFELFYDEIPYKMYVLLDSFEERPKDIKIFQTIYILKSQKHIFLSNIKKLGIMARKKMEKFLKKKVHLFTNIKEK